MIVALGTQVAQTNIQFEWLKHPSIMQQLWAKRDYYLVWPNT